MRRNLALAAAGAAIILAGTGCGSASGDDDGGSGSGGGSDAGLAHAKAAVAKAEKQPASFPVPDAKVTGVSKLRGKTVYYVPITQQAAQFKITGAALKKALHTVGISLQICNGNSNPSQVSGCVNQAVGAHAGAIITDSVPYAMVANALDAAQHKGIPVAITDQIPDSAHPAGDKLAYLEGAGADMLTSVADWIIADSGGTANVLINESTDSPSTKAYVAAAQREFKKYCTGCTVATNTISSANFSMIASSTSSALLSHPQTDYLVSEFDQYLQPTIGGLQQSGKKAKVKATSAAATLSGLQMVKSKALHADAAQASAFQGWASADMALRLMTGQPVKTQRIPSRLFDDSNIGDATLTGAAQDSGAWFGPSSYISAYQKLWGVS